MNRIWVLFTIIWLSQLAAAESLVVVDKAEESLVTVETDSGRKKEQSVGYLPHEVAVSSKYSFVSNYGHQHVRSFSLQNQPGNSISVIRNSDSKHIKEIQLGEAPCAPHGVEVSADDRYLFVTCEGRQEVAVVDVQKLELIRFLRTNQPGSHMLTAGKDNRLYITNFWIGTLSIIDIQSGELLNQMQVGRSVEGIGLSPDGKSLYLTIVEANQLVKISTKSLTVEKQVQIPEGYSPIRVVVSNDNERLVVNHAGSASTGIYDSETLQLIANIPVGRQPIGLAISRHSGLAYVANMKDGSVSVIDVTGAKLSKTLNLGMKAPDGLAVMKGKN